MFSEFTYGYFTSCAVMITTASIAGLFLSIIVALPVYALGWYLAFKYGRPLNED